MGTRGRFSWRVLRGATVTVGWVLLVQGAAAEPYTPVEIPTLGGAATFPRDMNNAGQVVGKGHTSEGDYHAFIWDETYGILDLGTLGGESSSASAINELGHVAGNSETESGDTHAFLWDPFNGMRDLGSLGGDSWASAINDCGQVAGTSWNDAGRLRVFLWDDANGMQDIGTLGGDSAKLWGDGAYGPLSNAGSIVGSSRTMTGVPESIAFLWDPVDGMHNLGTLGGESSYACAVNDAGQVCGVARLASGQRHAFVWDCVNGMQDLGTFGDGDYSEADDINGAGEVLGEAHTCHDTHPFVWDSVNGMRDLGTLGGWAGAAYAMNSSGQVVGDSEVGSPDSYVYHAFLWDPANPSGILDLNDLVDQAPWELERAELLNDHGDIVGTTQLPAAYVTFFLKNARVAFRLDTEGEGSTDPPKGEHNIGQGTRLLVRALPAPGWQFDHWNGHLSGLPNPAEVILTTDMSCQAVFVQQTGTQCGGWQKGAPLPRWGSSSVADLVLLALVGASLLLAGHVSRARPRPH